MAVKTQAHSVQRVCKDLDTKIDALLHQTFTPNVWSQANHSLALMERTLVNYAQSTNGTGRLANTRQCNVLIWRRRTDVSEALQPFTKRLFAWQCPIDRYWLICNQVDKWSNFITVLSCASFAFRQLTAFLFRCLHLVCSFSWRFDEKRYD